MGPASSEKAQTSESFAPTVAPKTAPTETSKTLIQNVINSDNLNEISEPDSEAFSIFLDTFFKELNVSSESATSKFSDIFFATLNETLEKVPKEDGDKFSSLLFANL